MNSALASKSDHTIPLELFRDTLDEHFSDDDVRRQIETALNWGRYGDIFDYDSESDRLVAPRNLAEDGGAVTAPLMTPRSENTPSPPSALGKSFSASLFSIDRSAHCFRGDGVVLWFALV